MSEKHDKPTDHAPDDELRPHVFDGIQEYDKKLPNWWLMTLYGAIVFSVAYWSYHHIFEVGNTPERKLAQAQARAAAFAAAGGASDFTDEKLFAMSLDTGLIGKGRTAYTTNCAACHGPEAGGAIGPSLNDDTWIHGGMPTQILRVIQEGTPNGMPGWRSMLGDVRTAEITAFLLSLNPPPPTETGSGPAAPDPAPGGE
jgi:cytochrome c oxidase cbb3-type subunit III